MPVEPTAEWSIARECNGYHGGARVVDVGLETTEFPSRSALQRESAAKLVRLCLIDRFSENLKAWHGIRGRLLHHHEEREVHEVRIDCWPCLSRPG